MKPTCCEPGCGAVSRYRGLCGPHYWRWLKNRPPEALPRRRATRAERAAPLRFEVVGDLAFGFPRNRECEETGQRFVIDVVDLPRIADRPWSFTTNSRYVWHRSSRTMLHRFLMDAPPELEVDHVNGDPTDNRRSNLRFASHAANLQNIRQPGGVTGIRNVKPFPSGGYTVYMRVRGRGYSGGKVFATIEEAAARADEMRAQLMPFAVRERTRRAS